MDNTNTNSPPFWSSPDGTTSPSPCNSLSTSLTGLSVRSRSNSMAKPDDHLDLDGLFEDSESGRSSCSSSEHNSRTPPSDGSLLSPFDAGSMMTPSPPVEGAYQPTASPLSPTFQSTRPPSVPGHTNLMPPQNGRPMMPPNGAASKIYHNHRSYAPYTTHPSYFLPRSTAAAYSSSGMHSSGGAISGPGGYHHGLSPRIFPNSGLSMPGYGQRGPFRGPAPSAAAYPYLPAQCRSPSPSYRLPPSSNRFRQPSLSHMPTPMGSNSRVATGNRSAAYQARGGAAGAQLRGQSYERLEAFLKPRPPHCRDIVPKFYKSVIDDVLNNVREIFLDDGVDEQVIQELRLLWERKINESRAIDHAAAAAAAAAANSTTSNSKSSNSQSSKKSSASNSSAAAANSSAPSNPSLPASSSAPSLPSVSAIPSAPSNSSASSNSSAAGGQTSVITSNPHHAKNGPVTGNNTNSNANNSEVKYNQTIVGGPGDQKMVLLPNNPGQPFVMAPQTQFVLTPNMLNQLQLQGSLITTGPGGQPTVLHHHPYRPSTIQYAAARAAGPTLQQVRTIGGTTFLVPGQVVSQPGAANVAPNTVNTRVAQLDGLGDSSSDDEDEDDYRDNDDDADDNDDEMNDEENDGGIEDEEPLNSGDDVSDEDPNELFDTDNVVVCQYDKITRSRNKWKFHFKDGIMNLQGKDYVFQKAVGDAEW